MADLIKMRCERTTSHSSGRPITWEVQIKEHKPKKDDHDRVVDAGGQHGIAPALNGELVVLASYANCPKDQGGCGEVGYALSPDSDSPFPGTVFVV